jgi:hypothetical protein
LLAGVLVMIIGIQLLDGSGVGPLLGALLVVFGLLLQVFSGWSSGVFVDSTKGLLVGRVFGIARWTVAVVGIQDISAVPTKEGPALLRLVDPGMWKVRITLKAEHPSRDLPAELGWQLLGRSSDDVVSELRRRLGMQ